jgi:hypothetical protein
MWMVYYIFDARNDRAVFKSFFNKKQNVSFCFDPSTLTCSNCNGETHSILDRTSVFVLADQCFPPVLAAAGGGGCVNIICIENGSLSELSRLFVDLLVGASVRVCSLILMLSVSHLAAVGTAAYAENFVRAARTINTSMAGKVTVQTGVPVLRGRW